MIKINSLKYIKEIIKKFEKKYGELRKENVPCTPKDHPELDDTPLLNDEEKTHYQSNIRICQWISTACRMDITFAVSSLS